MTIIFRKSQSSFERLPDRPFVWTLSSLRDFSGVGLRDGDYGVWMPAGSQPILLRYKAACTFAGGGTRPGWMTPIAYAGTPILQAWTDGSEDNDTLAAQGWTIVNDAGCSVTATGGFQRLFGTGSGGGAGRLRSMIGTVSAGTRMEMLGQARADIGLASAVVYCPLLADGVNTTNFGQSATGAGLGFFDGLSSSPLQTPLRNGAALSLPALASTAATLLVRDEGSTVLASASRDGVLLGDYRRNLQSNPANLLQISALKQNGTGNCVLDYRGQVITY